MDSLQRLTTEYVNTEDRVRLRGERVGNTPLTLWLTRRLLDRLIPHLTCWLEQQIGGTPRGDVLLGFAQEAATRQLGHELPVAASPDGETWLVESVDMQTERGRVKLLLRTGTDQCVGVDFEVLVLRQWLSILYRSYRQADWPAAVWPVWMEVKPSGSGTAVMLH